MFSSGDDDDDDDCDDNDDELKYIVTCHLSSQPIQRHVAR
jgi:hypothetical protein